uniref:Uncharacterized protein n=1 Tax=Globodera rostochiensis TaxID=31243 RepID=A0A914GSV4_GLORO
MKSRKISSASSHYGGAISVVEPKNPSSSKNASQGFESQSMEWDFSNPAPQFIQAPQIAQQSSNFISDNPGSSTSASNRGKSTNSGGGSRKITFKRFKNDPRAMALVEQHNNNEITDTALSEALEQINHKMSTKAMYLYLNMLNEEKKAGSGAPNFQDTQIAGQSYNFTSDNPGSSSHYGGIVPSQQAPPMDGTLVPSQAGNHSNCTTILQFYIGQPRLIGKRKKHQLFKSTEFWQLVTFFDYRYMKNRV